MRYLRQQLIEIFERTRRETRMGPLPRRLAAVLVHDFVRLLPFKEGKKNVEVLSRTLTYGDLHRHIITLRCPDQAFYLDAIKGYLLRQKIQPIAQQTIVIGMDCDENGCTLALRQPGRDHEKNFMFVALHISATVLKDRMPLFRDIRAILQAVDLSVTDFIPMRTLIGSLSKSLKDQAPEDAALLSWLNDNRYLYFGMSSNSRRLGLMRQSRVFEHIAPGLEHDIAAIGPAASPGLDWIPTRSAQHYLYSAANVEVFRISWKQETTGQMHHAVVIGHFSRSARFTNASRVPVLRRRWMQLAADPLLQHSAFYCREIRTIFDRLPKPELLCTPVESWLKPIRAVVDMAGPLDTVAQLIQPQQGDIAIVFVAMAAERFGPNTLNGLMQHLQHDLGIVIHGQSNFGVGPHRLLFLYVDKALKNGSAISSLESGRIHKCVQQSLIFWRDRAKLEVLRHARKIDLPTALAELEALPSLYADIFPPSQFLEDLQVRQQVLQSGRCFIRVHPHRQSLELHIISADAIPLGDLVDRIRAFGLIAEREAAIDFGATGPAVHLSSIHCRAPAPMQQEDCLRLRRALEQVFNDEADHDPLNQLLVTAALDIDRVTILISLRNHLIQLLPEAAHATLNNTLLRHPVVAARLLDLFAARHMPGIPESHTATAKADFEAALETVETLTDDRWFRALEALVLAVVRTNAFIRRTGEPVANKIIPSALPFAPKPVPWREIFVHGVHVEGVHLRAGKIARGGIRHSDRPADFRTEVLELMATQTIKNGQIVPTGAKGGFVTRLGGGADFVRRQYRIFIRSLLGLTDNLIHGQAVPPDGLRIPPEDLNDPYLVVAADKGTARFSDDANEESRLACFWLDDAFASGGRHGYDHKKIGITARGAWVCVAHHFARLGLDAWHAPLSAVGIGDMSGDVFGNGMLLNPNLRLLAAFNHRHIFLDPQPDTKVAYAERKRLFEAAQGWDHYDHRYISEGGGVYERSAKRILISKHVRESLAIDAKVLSGEELIQCLLRAPVDLLYNGGIGTYIKASDETHAEVRDPANNAVRINASELRCRVVCEGGNLGLTQKARLEFASHGGIINTDAMDNSAGVDMSDHEVNLKILFSATRAGEIGTAARNRILKRLTNTVADQCLHDNLLQSRALTLAQLDAEKHQPRFERLRDILKAEEWLDETNAPRMDEAELLATRPMLAVFLGQEKNRIHARLSEFDFYHKSSFSGDLLRSYFPASLCRRFGEVLSEHPLASEIVHTQASNHVVNNLGLAAILQLQTLLEHEIGVIVEALLISEYLLDATLLRESIWQHVKNIDMAAEMQHGLQEQVILFAEELLRLCPVTQLDKAWMKRQRTTFRRFRHSLAAQGIGGQENSSFLEALKTVAQAGLPDEAALHLAAMAEMSRFAAAVHLASKLDVPLARCLKASQACLHLLPFTPIENSLRSPLWGDEQAHALRREWLHRITLIKTRAIEHLLAGETKNMLRAGKNLWQGHRHWPALQALHSAGEEAAEDPGTRRMRLLLAMTQLESLVDES